tara:strand:+ start:381 stop:1517 length:1137 start_codon:yes stop_codon:yes gene_type:complete
MFAYMSKKELIKFKAHSVGGVVDRENNIIKGMTLIQADREALGHELFIDMSFIRSVVKQGKATGDVGLKARNDHPSACFSSMGSQIGRFKNFRTVENKAVADLHLAPFAFESNPQGNIGEFLMDVAENDPDIMGNSIVFTMSEAKEFTPGENDDPEALEFQFPHARLEKLHGCDVVDQGAATDGMFSVFGRPDYMAEQALKLVGEHEELFRTALEPLVTKLMDENKPTVNTDEIKDNINQKPNQMSKDQALLDAEFAVTPTAVAEEVTRESVVVEDEAVALTAEVESKEVALTEANEVLAGELKSEVDKNNALEVKFEALVAKFEAFSKESIGETVKPVGSTDVSIESNDSTKAEILSQERDENVSTWINDGFGPTVS